MKRRNLPKGLAVAAFGIGLFLSCCFPTKFVVITLAVLLVAAGVLIIKA
ncbi:MAG: hypothetical protein IJJ85_09235 [Clostridia bacterium]|nr:hypothetical protein [Clostridia bacterium]